ncbi:hypothetical protein TNCV_3553361 [Trichonephila clavipes]|nr:hypothetical protein TNCV_3553361 [Trichonephila clavipes]
MSREREEGPIVAHFLGRDQLTYTLRRPCICRVFIKCSELQQVVAIYPDMAADGQASSTARPNQWRYTLMKFPGVSQNRTIISE